MRVCERDREGGVGREEGGEGKEVVEASAFLFLS